MLKARTPAAAYVGQWLQSFREFPPRQKPGSFNLDQVMARKAGDLRLAEIDFIDDKAGKPVAINKFIGRRPIFAIRQFDGDHEMLLWTAAGRGARFMGIVHHTDAEREWSYDRTSSIGKLDKALDDARANGWTVMDMEKDWKRIFAFEK